MSDIRVELREISSEEMGLVEVAKSGLRKGRVAGLTSVCAAAITTDGAVYTAMDCRSRMSAVCAEPCLIGAMRMKQEASMKTIVAVCYTPNLEDIVVISPCGACRERIHYQYPDARVIVKKDGSLFTVAAADLFLFSDLF